MLRGAVGLASYFKLAPAIIGLTVVAAGTSVPELSVSLLAALHGKTDIAIGNVVGSNIFNIAAILGTVAIYKSLTISGNTIRLEYPFLLLITAGYIFLSYDGSISRFNAFFFIVTYIGFTYFLVKKVGKQLNPIESQEFSDEVANMQLSTIDRARELGLPILLTTAGVALLGFGADLTVDGAVDLGKKLGMSERLIGLTIIGAGTGLPELITSLVSSYRGRNDVAIANVIGSNLFNILGILGISALVSPLAVAPEIINSDNWWMLAATILMFPVLKSGLSISRREGIFLLCFYLAYLTKLIVS